VSNCHFFGGIFPWWDTSFILFYLFYFIIINLFVKKFLGAKFLHGCQIFEIFGCGFNDLFENEISKNLKQKMIKKEIARFLYLVQVGNHK
jgi:hypothetical protein